ncbi:MAG: hotdog fold thioesterase, partial [Rhodospirillales bacterium]|nr:hotdog fold thioesterase [Rhodospirillales bacterium]
MPDQAHRLARVIGRHMHDRDNAARALDIILDEIKPGYARMSMTVCERMLNSHGSCQGGVTFTLADAAFAYACNSYNHPTVAQSCSIHYPAPARLGDVLIA